MRDITIVNHRATERDPQTPIPGGSDSGRYARFDGTRYAATSQAATDALDPEATGGLLVSYSAVNGQLSIADNDTGEKVRGISAGAVAIGDMCRPAWNADETLRDRVASIETTALPEAAGTYYTTDVALSAATGADQEIWLRRRIIRHVVEEG